MQYNIPSSRLADTCQLTLTDLQGEHHFSSGSIIRLQAADNYTIVYFKSRRPFVVSKVLKVYDALLTPYGFIRTHRSHLVNKHFVKEIENYKVVMQDASMVDVCKRKRTKVARQLFN